MPRRRQVIADDTDPGDGSDDTIDQVVLEERHQTSRDDDAFKDNWVDLHDPSDIFLAAFHTRKPVASLFSEEECNRLAAAEVSLPDTRFLRDISKYFCGPDPGRPLKGTNAPPEPQPTYPLSMQLLLWVVTSLGLHVIFLAFFGSFLGALSEVDCSVNVEGIDLKGIHEIEDLCAADQADLLQGRVRGVLFSLVILSTLGSIFVWASQYLATTWLAGFAKAGQLARGRYMFFRDGDLPSCSYLQGLVWFTWGFLLAGSLSFFGFVVFDRIGLGILLRGQQFSECEVEEARTLALESAFSRTPEGSSFWVIRCAATALTISLTSWLYIASAIQSGILIVLLLVCFCDLPSSFWIRSNSAVVVTESISYVSSFYGFKSVRERLHPWYNRAVLHLPESLFYNCIYTLRLLWDSSRFQRIGFERANGKLWLANLTKVMFDFLTHQSYDDLDDFPQFYYVWLLVLACRLPDSYRTSVMTFVPMLDLRTRIEFALEDEIQRLKEHYKVVSSQQHQLLTLPQTFQDKMKSIWQSCCRRLRR